MQEVKTPSRGTKSGFSALRSFHLPYLFLVFVAQSLLTFFSLRLYLSNANGAERLVTASAYVVPLLGYFGALWTAQPLKRHGPVLRSVFAAALAFTALFMASVAIGFYFYYFGAPL